MRYLILQSQETKGPYTLGQLRAMWNSGTVTGDTLFCKEGSEDWQTLEALAAELEEAPVTEPPLSAAPPMAAPLPVPQRAQPPPLSGKDDLVYDDGVFRITPALVVVNGTTYALRNINSVKVVKTGLGFFSGAIACIFILFGFGLLAKGLVSAVFGVLLIAVIGYFMYQDNKRCILAFDTSSGAVTGFESKDPAYLKKMADKTYSHEICSTSAQNDVFRFIYLHRVSFRAVNSAMSERLDFTGFLRCIMELLS